MKIVISGTTGVGKSTTTKELANYFKNKGKKVFIIGELVLESPFFDLYFANMEEWCFLSQFYFLLERFRGFVQNEKKAQEIISDQEDAIFIYDRYFTEDKIFSRLDLVTKTTAKALSNSYKYFYQELLKKIISDFEKPDYFFMLKADFEEIENRMKHRGRKEEMNFPKDYWLNLYNGYYHDKQNRNVLKRYSKKFIEIDTNNSNPQEVVEKIISHIN